METVVLVALISGLAGFTGTLASISWNIISKRMEKKKLDSSVDVDTSVVANNLVGSAGELNQMYKDSLRECHEQICLLEKKMVELSEKIDINQKKIDDLTIRDKDSTELIYRLVRGIRILIQQMKDANITPMWIPSTADLEYKSGQ